MADYRFSAQIIGRSAGRSSVAAAAYRAGQDLRDDRTGLDHDFTRKEGVLHSEIMAPADAPEWMLDRSKLWNAVEAVETRRNSQMAREFQLSLPHELGFEDNRELVRDFVQEQFVAKGMIADVSIHAPSSYGDQRNIHAHVMLTTRTLTDEGFGKKERAWNDRAQLEDWREQWAHHQNRALARQGESGRVDHRSYERQGVDREPTLHMGPHASEMDRNGIQTNLAAANDVIRARNELRGSATSAGAVLDAKIAFEQRKFEGWADRKRADLSTRHFDKAREIQNHAKDQLRSIKDLHTPQHGRLAVSQEELDRRLESRGFRKVIRDVFGRTRRDREALEAVRIQRADLQRSELAEKAQVQDALRAQRAAQRAEQAREASLLERGIRRARERREGQNWEAQAEAFKARRVQEKKSPTPPARELIAGPKVDPQDKRVQKATMRRQQKLDAFEKRLEASRGSMKETPGEPGPAQDFARARKNTRDRERD